MTLEIKDYGTEQGLSREWLASRYGEVYDTGELSALFLVHSFAAPFVSVTRKADSQRGFLCFQHSPRYYYDFVPAGETR